MDDNEIEYRLPAKVLTNRDPILLNKLSIREFLQWLFFFLVVYFVFRTLPFGLEVKLVVSGIILMFAMLFIHSPINGLAGIEWLFIHLRFALEKKKHLTIPALSPEPDYNPLLKASITSLPLLEIQVGEEAEGKEAEPQNSPLPPRKEFEEILK